MSDKKITELQLRSNVNDDVNLPADDGIQTYRVTAPQMAAYALAKPRKIVYKTAGYTAVSSDHVISCDASTGFTLSLPTAVGIEGKIYKILRTDIDYSQVLTIDPASTELIDGLSTFLLSPKESVEIISDNVGWEILTRTSKFRAETVVHTGAGHGSTNNCIRCFANNPTNTPAITYDSDSVNGDSFTINEDGLYSFSYTDMHSSSANYYYGLSLNSTNLTSGVQTLSYPELIQISCAAVGPIPVNMAICLFLQAGDVVRAHCESSAGPLGTADYVMLRIAKIGE